jgi:PTS system mannose-specific IIA component
MFVILVVTHDDLAAQLVKAARNIVGENLKNIIAVSIGWEQDLDMARDKIKKALKEVCPSGEAVILTDMFGGTPTNVSLTFLEEGKIEVLTGVNLPMVIKLAQLQITDTETMEAARLARDRGKSTILIASEALHGNNDENISKG